MQSKNELATKYVEYKQITYLDVVDRLIIIVGRMVPFVEYIVYLDQLDRLDLILAIV